MGALTPEMGAPAYYMTNVLPKTARKWKNKHRALLGSATEIRSGKESQMAGCRLKPTWNTWFLMPQKMYANSAHWRWRLKQVSLQRYTKRFHGNSIYLLLIWGSCWLALGTWTRLWFHLCRPRASSAAGRRPVSRKMSPEKMRGKNFNLTSFYPIFDK